MLSADRRIGIRGNFKIGLNEVAIKLVLPLFAIEIARQRLTPAYFNRVVTGEMCTPEESVVAGFLDEVVPPEDLAARSLDVARSLTTIDYATHSATKLRVRAAALAALDQAILAEFPG
jgi:enoyl-CoA hydratase